jgi:hypothetical protein
MLEPDQWDSVLANVKGTVVHGSERSLPIGILD